MKHFILFQPDHPITGSTDSTTNQMSSTHSTHYTTQEKTEELGIKIQPV